jgi:hypothetical protein
MSREEGEFIVSMTLGTLLLQGFDLRFLQTKAE